jgi:hypothetical protein
MVGRGEAVCAIGSIEACSGTFRNPKKRNIPIFRAICAKALDFSVTVLLTIPETFSETTGQLPKPWARKEQPMRRKIPSSRWIAVAVAAG